MSDYLDLDPSVHSAIRNCLYYAQLVSEDIEHLRGVISHFVTAKLAIFEKYPELLPRNRRSLQRAAVQRGGYLYHEARRYVAISEHLVLLRGKVDRMVDTRRQCIEWERQVRRQITEAVELQEEKRRLKELRREREERSRKERDERRRKQKEENEKEEKEKKEKEEKEEKERKEGTEVV